MVDFLITLFLGYLGIHKFKQGKVGIGFLYLFTFGLFGIGWIVDVVMALKKLSLPTMPQRTQANKTSTETKAIVSSDEKTLPETVIVREERSVHAIKKDTVNIFPLAYDLSKSNCIYGELFDVIPDCVITDIETSGLIYNKNSIIEIAAIKIKNSKVVDIYSSLVHRDKPLDSKITSLTGITTQMLRDCDKSLARVMSEYRNFVEDLPLVGHNILAFDIKFINEAYAKIGQEPLYNNCVDTLKLSYELCYTAESHKLKDLADYAEISIGTSHRAIGDCETTAFLYRYMMNKASVALLKWSQKGKTFSSDTVYPQYILRNYPPETCSKYHEKLISSGYLEQADAQASLLTLKVQDLKNLLAEHGFQATGTKQVLVDRIIENIDTASLNLPVFYVPSVKGLSFLSENTDAEIEQ